MSNQNRNDGPGPKTATDQASPVIPSTTEQDRVTPRSDSENEPKELPPEEVYKLALKSPSRPLDTSLARYRYNNPDIIARENQADFLALCLVDGSYIHNWSAVEKMNARRFPKFPLKSHDELYFQRKFYMSGLLAAIDGLENVVWGNRGFAEGYRLPGRDGGFLRGMYPWVLGHYGFQTIPAAQQDYGSGREGISLDHFYRILSHRWVGLLDVNEGCNGWKPGPSNRHRSGDGEIVGAVDYVITHPSSGILYLTPHGSLVIDKLILDWVQLIF